MPTLFDLVTEHPGGWVDILEALTDHAGETVTATVPGQPNGNPVERNTLVGEIAGKIRRAAELPGESSGRLAANALAELSTAGLPVPGDKRWLKPANTWFEKGKNA